MTLAVEREGRARLVMQVGRSSRAALVGRFDAQAVPGVRALLDGGLDDDVDDDVNDDVDDRPVRHPRLHRVLHRTSSPGTA